MNGYGRPKPSAETSVQYREDDVEYFERAVRDTEADVARPLWHWVRTSVFTALFFAAVSAVGWAFNTRQPFVDYETQEGQGGVIVGVFAAVAAITAVCYALDARSERNRAPQLLAQRKHELEAGRQRLANARTTLEAERAAAQKLRNLPAALDTLQSYISTDSRDWGQSRADARLYGIIVGWSDDEGDAWETLAEKHHWTPEYVATLKSNHEAYEFALEQEAARRAP